MIQDEVAKSKIQLPLDFHRENVKAGHDGLNPSLQQNAPLVIQNGTATKRNNCYQ